MFKFTHRGITTSLDLDATKLTGDAIADASSEYAKGLVSGCAVAISENGVVLATGAEGNFVGFLVEDVAGNPYQNQNAIASGAASVTLGNCAFYTDRVVEGITIKKGDKLYVATNGLLTNVSTDNGSVVATAGSAFSASAPELLVLV
jgi:hypothetical protein